MGEREGETRGKSRHYQQRVRMPSDWETSLEGSVTSVAACPVAGVMWFPGRFPRDTEKASSHPLLVASCKCHMGNQPIPFEPLPANTEPEMEVSWLLSLVKPSL